MNLDLGYTPSHYLGGATAMPEPDKDKEPPVYYPSLTIEGKAAKKLMKGFEPGETIEATVQLKVVGVHNSEGSSREYDNGTCRVELEVASINVAGVEDEEEESVGRGKKAEDAVDDYFVKKKRTDGGSDTDNDHDD